MNSRSVLIVDDVDEVRALLRMWFEQRAFSVTEARDGEEAITVAQQQQPALIIMDIGMPNRSGISSLYKIRKLDGLSETPVIVFTGYSTPDLHDDARRAGCLEILTKPLDTTKLDALVQKVFPA